MNKPVAHLSLAFLLSLTAPALTAGGIYKWVDENGKVHFGDRPPDKDAAKEMTVKGGGSADSLSSQSDHRQAFAKLKEMIDAYNKQAGSQQEKTEAYLKIRKQLDKACNGAKPAMENFGQGLMANGEKLSTDEKQQAGYKHELDEWAENCDRVRKNLRQPASPEPVAK